MKRSVLVADDDSMIRGLLRLMLEPAGFQVLEAENGLDALAKVSSNRPDALIVNVMMPKMDGFAVCEALRRDQATALLPIVILSGQAHLTAVYKGMRAGATDYLTKPTKRADLIQCLHNALGDASTTNDLLN